MLRMSVCQLPLNIENQNGNFNLAKAAIHEATAQEAKLIVLPELTNSGCAFRNIDEIDFFTLGKEAPLIVDTNFGRIATMVRYDIEFPEWVRLIMLGDATIFALPIKFGLTLAVLLSKLL